MEAIEIKILGRGDAAVLTNVAPEVFDDAIDIQAADAFLADPRHHLAVALEGDLVIGFASAVYYVHPDKPRPECWINEVGVAPAWQAHGVGKALLHALLEAARKAGCAEAWVLTDRSNAPAMRLYASVGGSEAPGDTVMFTFPLRQDR
jgi:GNAT superfamily N-acetyltransferase